MAVIDIHEANPLVPGSHEMKDIDFASLPGWIAVPLGIIMFLGGWYSRSSPSWSSSW
jgi:hypothetical protein